MLDHAFKNCKRDVRKANDLIATASKLLLCNNLHISQRIKWPHYFNRAGRFRPSKVSGFADTLIANEDYRVLSEIFRKKQRRYKSAGKFEQEKRSEIAACPDHPLETLRSSSPSLDSQFVDY